MSIRLLLYLPSAGSYADRVDVFNAVAEKIELIVILFNTDDTAALPVPLRPNVVVARPGDFGIPRRGLAVGALFAVWQLIARYSINVVHDTFGMFGLWLITRASPLPVATVTSQFILAEWDWRNYFWPRYRWRAFRHRNLLNFLLRLPMQRLAFHAADVTVVQAPGLIQRVRGLLGLEQCAVTWIPNSVCFVEPQRTSTEPSRRVELLYVGGLSHGKGFDRVLAITEQLQAEGVRFRLTAVGQISPQDVALLGSWVATKGDDESFAIVAKEPGRELRNRYRSTDWLIHPTHVDGSPRVVLEALAAGVRVVGSRHPGIVVFDPAGEFIVYDDGVAAAAATIALEATDSGAARRRIDAGLKWIRETFTSRPVAARYIEMYASLVRPCRLH